MLNITIDENFGCERKVKTDIEKLFDMTKLRGSDKEKELIQKIEKGEYNDCNSYIDRFGFKLHKSEMSAGCKTALCIVEHPDMLIDTMECGLNARDIIVNLIHDGNIIINYNDAPIEDMKKSEAISVKIDGKIFNDITELNAYLKEEY